jgi:hypothetical protein
MIRLLTVIGHGTTLLPHFIKHYQQYVDEINIAVYETDIYPQLSNEVSQIIDNQDNVKVVKVIKDRIFDWDRVTKLYNFIKSQKPNDWWVVADIDELHLYPNDNLRYLVDTCEKYGYQLVRGGFIDRIGENGEFSEIMPDVSLFDQFPNAGFFRYPMSKACPNKVCVMKGHIELTSGQHYAKINGETTWRWQGWNHPLIAPIDEYNVQVHHFKWDSTCVERIKQVADIKKDYSFSDEYLKMYKALRNNNFEVDVTNEEYMFEYISNNDYKQWNKLIKKIISI